MDQHPGESEALAETAGERGDRAVLHRTEVDQFEQVVDEVGALPAADAVSVFIRASLVPLATPESMRGRVLAVENVFIGASNELGAVESGVAAHFLGVVGAVVSGGAGTLVVVALWWRYFPALRDVDRFADVNVATQAARRTGAAARPTADDAVPRA